MPKPLIRPRSFANAFGLVSMNAIVLVGSTMAAAADSPAAHPAHAVAGSHAVAPAAAPGDSARARRWREDLAYVVGQVLTVHPRPFALSARSAFDSAAAAIGRSIPERDDPTLAIEMMRMVALLGDGHSMLIGTMPSTGFGGLCPIWLRSFEDGLYLAAAGPEVASHVGARVTRVGTLPAAEALERVLTIVSGDNRYTRLDRAALFMMSPAALHALGISPTADRVTLELESGGKRTNVTVAAGRPPEGFPQAFNETEPRFPADWRTARDAVSGELPRCDRRPEEAWWSEMLGPERLLYLRLRRIDAVSGDVSFARFLRRTFALADSVRPAAMVIDLRHDHGGNNTILDPLVHDLIARPWLDRDGGVFVITDRGTFSAAMNAAVFLETHTHAVFAGEPTGGRVNHYGDARTTTTPNFGMLLMVSEWPWAGRLPWDPRPWIAPALAVPATFADWRDGKDRPLDAVIDAVRNGTFQQRVLAAARSGDVESAVVAAEAWQRAHPNPWNRNAEEDWDALTSRLIDESAPRDAMTVAEARTRLYTRSGQAWRRLGEAALEAGDRAKAIESLRKTLEVAPQNRAARAMLERLGERP